MRVVFDHVDTIATGVKSFYFKPTSPVNYTAGQYVELVLPHDLPDSRGEKRWFTLSSSPTESMLAITTKFTKENSSFKRALLNIKPGRTVHMSDPMGDFVLPKDKKIPLIYVAGGIGITPVRSMIKWLSDKAEHRRITVLYAAGDETQLAFLPLLKSYELEFIKLLDKPLTARLVVELTKPLNDSRIYISGPEPMVEDLVDQFSKTSIESYQLVTDYFEGYESI